MIQLLGKEVKITQAISTSSGSAASGTIAGAILDMSGYEGVLTIIQLGGVTDTLAGTASMQQGTASNMTDAAALAGTGQTIATNADNTIYAIDLYRPNERYVRMYADRGTATMVCNAVYLQYGSSKKPPSHHSSVTGIEYHISPTEGTA